MVRGRQRCGVCIRRYRDSTADTAAECVVAAADCSIQRACKEDRLAWPSHKDRVAPKHTKQRLPCHTGIV